MKKTPSLPLLFHVFLVYGFLYLPIAVLVLFSFNVSQRNAVWKGFTLKWYGSLVQNPEVLRAFTNSLQVAVLATLISAIIGTLGAFALTRFNFGGKGMLNASLLLPMMVPEVVMGIALLSLFVAISMKLSLYTIVVAHVAFSISYVTVTVRARLAGFDQSLEEAAMDLGATPVTTFIRVTLPLIFPGVLAGGLLAFTLSFDDFVIAFFTAGVGATTLPLKIYSMVKFGVTPEINAISTLMLSLTFLAMLTWLKYFGEKK